jgi:hypothetical protein
MPIGTINDPRELKRAEPSPWGAIHGQRTIWPTPLQADLLRATLLADERALQAWGRIRPELDVASMDYVTQALLPALRSNLLALGSDDELLKLFKGVHRFAWARNQILLSKVMPLVSALEDAGVPTLLLKGAALVADRRQDAGMRQMTDIDVLVPTAQTGAAIELITEHGLKPVEGLPAWYAAEYMPLFRPSINVGDGAEGQLDLHWHVLHWSCHPRADDGFWAASVPVTLRGVRTRALCPADELLHVIVHGARWSEAPTYRWVLDAAQIARGLCGPVDFERLATQARRHRVAPAVREGLMYLRGIAEVDIPDDALRSLRIPAPFQRLELRLQATRPSQRGAVGRAAVVHGQYLRRQLPPGASAGPLTHARLAGRRLGVQHLGHVRYLPGGGRPGPSRPFVETEAPIGSGSCTPPPIGWDEPIDLADPDTVRRHCLYGLWFPEEWGCWIAGREARLAVALGSIPNSSLVLELGAGVAAASPDQRLEVLLDDRRVATVSFDAERRRVDAEQIVLPAELVGHRSRIELVFRAPDARSPIQSGTGEDMRPLGVFVQRLAFRPPFECPTGERLALGSGTKDRPMLAGGWSHPDPGGRWTIGPVARLLLRPSSAPTLLEWEAAPVSAPSAPPTRVEVTANGVALGAIDYEGDPRRVQLPLQNAAGEHELLLSWRIHNPRSPKQLGLSEDPRPLGLFFRSITLH